MRWRTRGLLAGGPAPCLGYWSPIPGRAAVLGAPGPSPGHPGGYSRVLIRDDGRTSRAGRWPLRRRPRLFSSLSRFVLGGWWMVRAGLVRSIVRIPYVLQGQRVVVGRPSQRIEQAVPRPREGLEPRLGPARDVGVSFTSKPAVSEADLLVRGVPIHSEDVVERLGRHARHAGGELYRRTAR
jgi:hypothetical protein